MPDLDIEGEPITASAPETTPAVDSQAETADTQAEAPMPEDEAIREPLVKDSSEEVAAGTQQRAYTSPRSGMMSQPEREDNETTYLVFALSLGSLFWYAVGVLFFCLYEDWGFIDGWYFVTVTITSVGYGVLVPSDSFSRMVLAAYVLVSVFLVTFALAHHTAHILHHLESMIINDSNTRLEKSEDARERLTGETSSRRSWAICKMFGLRALWTSCLLFVIILTGALIGTFYYKFDFWESVYWSVVTLSTVGYGDLVPSSPGERVVGGIFVLCGTVTFALAVTQLMAIVIANTKKKNVIKYLTPPLTAEALAKMNPAGEAGNITREKYVNFMLVRGGFVEERVLKDLATSFDVLDQDGNGYLNEDDFKQVYDSQNAPHAEQLSKAFGHVYHQGID